MLQCFAYRPAPRLAPTARRPFAPCRPAWFRACLAALLTSTLLCSVLAFGLGRSGTPESPAQPGPAAAAPVADPWPALPAPWFEAPAHPLAEPAGPVQLVSAERPGWPLATGSGAGDPAPDGTGLNAPETVAPWSAWVIACGIYSVLATIGLVLLAGAAYRRHGALEATVERRTRDLAAALGEREQLLKEVHHRVKNNMQIISSLIRMQDRMQTSAEETIRRVHAMALVHDIVYAQGELARVDLAAYLHRLCDALEGLRGGEIHFDLKLAPVTVALDRAMPFALILSEVVTNAIRHAFKARSGTIAIALSERDGIATVRVHDDGTGSNPEVDGRGFGLRLVKSLSVQLDATARFDRTEGTTFTMSFPLQAPGQNGAPPREREPSGRRPVSARTSCT